MKGVYVFDFGIKDDVQTYRVNGSKESLDFIISETSDLGQDFYEKPQPKYIRKGEWTMMLKVKVPVGVGANRGDQ